LLHFDFSLLATRLFQVGLVAVLTVMVLGLLGSRPLARLAAGYLPPGGIAGHWRAVEQLPRETIRAQAILETSAANMSQFSIMTFNVGDGAAQPADLARVLKESGADIVGLQEVTRKQADALKELLAQTYPYQIFIKDGIPGKGLLSKYPIIDWEALELDPGRPDLLTELDLNGQALRVIVVHPQPPRIHPDGIHWTVQTEAQFQRLFELASDGKPTVLLGDFNMTEQNPHYAVLAKAGLTDAYREAGQGPGNTFPLRWGLLPLIPLVRIDYIWHSAPLRAVGAKVGADAGSDHLPVLATVAWS
jgi:vancomycin resistance protein VanJ